MRRWRVWEPARYMRYADERGRPFGELVARVGARDPRHVVDLGCGTGTLTATLGARWPNAQIEGVDSSPAMLKEAQASVPKGGNVAFRLGDIRDWRPPAPVDVLISNAALQWVPDHREHLAGLLAQVASGGWLAFQVPGNFGEPSHVITRELAAEPRWDLADRITFPSSHEPAEYLDVFADAGCEVDAWETTYLHLLHGEDPVFEWISGTGARPALAALDNDRRKEFVAVLKYRLRKAYPPRSYGTVLPFRRIFVVARKA